MVMEIHSYNQLTSHYSDTHVWCTTGSFTASGLRNEAVTGLLLDF